MNKDLEAEKNKDLLQYGVKQESNEKSQDFIFDPETGEPNDDI